MSTTARDRGRAYLRTPGDGRAWMFGIFGGIVGVGLVNALAAALGHEDSFPVMLLLAVVVGLAVGLAVRAVQAARHRRSPDAG